LITLYHAVNNSGYTHSSSSSTSLIVEAPGRASRDFHGLKFIDMIYFV